MKKLLSITLTLVLLLSFSIPAKAVEISPIPISTWEDLYNMRSNLDGDYELTNDLDEDSPGYEDYASDTANGGEGWIPVGEYVPDVDYGVWIPNNDLSSPFTGSFEGNGHTISGLIINRPLLYGVGLFGYIRAGSVSNLTLANVDITGVRHTGSIVGYTWGAAIDNVQAGGDVTSKNNVGGLVGTIRYDTSVRNSSTSADVRGTGTGSLRAGGLAGALYESNIINSHATGNVYGNAYDVGGLVGSTYEEPRIENCYATGDVTGTKGAVGGLVGSSNQATLIVDSHATGNVSGVTMELGGLVGDIGNGTTVRNSYATGNVTTLNGKWVGGLIGISYGSFIEFSYATGNVSSSSNEMVGGLVGYLSAASAIRDSYATGNAVGYARVGGLAGWVAEGSSVDRGYSKGFVLGTVDAGGLIGLVSEGTVASSYWDMQASDMTNSAGGTGKQTAEMLISGTYSDWDFSGVWKIEESTSYPYFLWQGDVNVPYPSLNIAPVAISDTATVDEDTVDNEIEVLSNDSDADGGILSVTGVTQPADGTVKLAGGIITYTPDLDFIGTDTFFYTISDGQGSVDGARVTLTILNANNDIPVVLNDSYITNEDAVLSVPAPGVFANDTDADDDNLNALVVDEPSEGVLILESNGAFTYTPDSGFYGSDSFTYTAFDGFVETTPAVVTITVVQAPNEAPLARDDSYSMTESDALNQPSPGVLENDIDANGDSLTAMKLSDPAHGTLTLNADGSFTYMPVPEYSGIDVFTYKATDGFLESTSAAVTITITIDEEIIPIDLNDAPVAMDDSYTTSEDAVLSVSAPGVFLNDTDSDGDILTATLLDRPDYGILVWNMNGYFTYTPVQDFSGSDSFSYIANDGADDSNTANVTITVTAVNDAPIAGNDVATVLQGSSDNIIDVLLNDSDIDSGTLSILGVVQPVNGIVVFSSNSMTYSPNSGYYGTDSFTYTVSDDLGATSIATVAITVTAVQTQDPDQDQDTDSDRSTRNTSDIPEPQVPAGIVGQALGTEDFETIEGKSVFTLTVSEAAILREIELIMESIASGDTPVGSKVIEIPLTNSSADEAIVSLNGETIKALEENGFDLSITREGVQYIVSAAEFMVDQIADEMGIDADDLASIEFKVSMGEPSAETLALYEEIAASLDIDFIIPPISFEITAVATMANSTTREMKVDTFSTYAERIFEVPAGVDPAKITTGIVFNADGTYSHVPTIVYEEDGVWYVKVNSLTNSDYSIIWNPITVASVQQHWSQAAVEDMVSRLVIRDPETFAPDTAITRGDFAEYIAKAIGVYRTGIAVADFSDVAIDDMQANAITAAADYGIIKGYPDGTFRPDGLINRQEAMVMFARASRIVSLESEDMARINTFADAGEIAGWALDDVTTAVGSGIFNGRSEDMLEVTGTFTYAEAATAVRNMLIEAGLIND